MTAASPPQVQRARLIESYGKIPLHFEENWGQADPRVRFLSRGSGYTLFLTPQEAVFSLRGPSPADDPERENGAFSLRMRFLGTNPAPTITGKDLLPGKSNYFIGNDPKKWRTNVPHYAKVEYKEVYPGIDLVFYGGDQRGLEYDFIVRPGADPAKIRLQFEGAEKITRDAEGNLVLHTPGGELVQRAPVIYQEVGDERKKIEGGYVLLPSTGAGCPPEPCPGRGEEEGEEFAFVFNPKADSSLPPVAQNDTPSRSGKSRGEVSTIAFQVAAWDRTKPLVIDPVLVYSTYLGGSGWDRGIAITVDASRNAYVTGFTSSTDFPTAGAPLQAGLGGGNFDVFVTKLNAQGSALVYSTYLGGSRDDSGNAVAVDAAGNVYVTGGTNSTNFPTTDGAFDRTCGTDGFCNTAGVFNDAFLAKLNPQGSALVYSTYLGGSGFDQGNAIAVDAAGIAYVTGQGGLDNLPGCGGTGSPFVAKLDPFQSGAASLVYCTRLGGSGNDHGRGIVVDASGNAYVTGNTSSTSFPTTGNAFQANFGGVIDVFVVKLNSAGSAVVYSTYLGGNGFDAGYGIAVDASGNAYVVGLTESSNFPTANALDTTLGGSRDAFVAKLNAQGSALVYSTYLGGTDIEEAHGIALDASGNAYVTGSTGSSDFPTANALDAALGGTWDAFVAKLNAQGSALVYSTYLGGGGWDFGYGIAVDADGNAYVTGDNGSPDFPTASPFQVAYAGGLADAFVAKIQDTLSPTLTSVSPLRGPTRGGTTVTLTGAGFVAGSTTVTIGGSACASVNVTSATSLTCVTPARAAGAVNVTVTTTGGSATLAEGFTYGAFPALRFAARNLLFPPCAVGDTCPSPLTIFNDGDAELRVTSIRGNPSTEFRLDNIPGDLVVSASGTGNFNLLFSPSAEGIRSGTITVVSNDPGQGTVVLNITGTGTPGPRPNIRFATTTLQFGSCPVGQTCRSPISIYNDGDDTLVINGLLPTGEFGNVNVEGDLVCRPGSQCDFFLTFTPLTPGARSGTITVGSNDPDEPSVLLNIVGQGAGPKIRFAANVLQFGSCQVGQTCRSPISIFNDGQSMLHVRGLSPKGNFGNVNVEGDLLCAPGQQCDFTLTFSPTFAGKRVGIITITSDDPDEGEVVLAIIGTGGGEAPPAFLSSPLGKCQSDQGPCTRSSMDSLEVVSVLDHSDPNDEDGYNCIDLDSQGEVTRNACDGVVLAFDGSVALANNGANAPPYGYRKDRNSAPFSFSEMNYTGDNDDGAAARSYLNYDGHTGYDYRCELGVDYILAAAGGTIYYPVVSDPLNGKPGTFNTIRIIHDNGFETWYLHSQRNTVIPGNATRINTGAPIAKCGKEGVAGAHLHFELRKRPVQGTDPGIVPDKPIDPYQLGLWSQNP